MKPYSSRFTLTILLSMLFLLLTACTSATPAPPQPAPTPQAENPTAEPSPAAISETSAPTPPTAEPETVELPPTAKPTVEPTEETPTPQPTPAIANALLPGPLYFLNESEQIARLEADGRTLTPITTEAEPITDFDVSPAGDQVAYVSNNILITLDTSGENRREKVKGEVLDLENFDEHINKAIDRVQYSPDGQHIAFGLNGVNTVSAGDDNTVTVVQASDPFPDFSEEATPSEDPIRFFWPESWSPDGSNILMRFGYYPEGGGFALKKLGDNTLVELGNLCCSVTWSQDQQSLFFASNITVYTEPGLWQASASDGSVTTLVEGQPAQDGEPYHLLSHPHQTQDGRLLAFAVQAEDPFFAPNPTLHQVSPDGTLTPLQETPFSLGDVAWAADDSGAVLVDIGFGQQFPASGPMIWLPLDGTPVDLPANGRLPRWGSPVQSGTSSAPLPTASDLAALETLALANFGIDPTLEVEFGQIEAVQIQRLNGGEETASWWVVSTDGFRNFDLEQNHAVAIYAFSPEGWQALAQLELADDFEIDPPEPAPDYLGQGSVRQVFVEPSRIWLTVEGGVGAHSGIFSLLSFDGETLRLEAANFNSSPGAGQVADLNEDGTLEVLLDYTDPYIFAYATGVRLVQFGVLRWDAAQQKLIPVALTPLPDEADAPLRNWNSRAIDLAEAGLWQDALAAIQEAEAIEGSNEIVAWNEAIIRLNAEAKAAITSSYPLLDHVFAGNYAAAVDIMRDFPPDQIFSPTTPLIVETSAEGSEEYLSEYLLTNSNAALQAQPELAPAYFLRGWATFLADPESPAALEDIQRAAKLAPGDSLFEDSVEYLTN